MYDRKERTTPNGTAKSFVICNEYLLLQCMASNICYRLLPTYADGYLLPRKLPRLLGTLLAFQSVSLKNLDELKISVLVSFCTPCGVLQFHLKL